MNRLISKVRNHKSEPVEVRIVEHLCRWTGWDIIKNSDPFKKIDSRTVESLAQVPADGEKTVSCKVHYSWRRSSRCSVSGAANYLEYANLANGTASDSRSLNNREQIYEFRYWAS